MVVKVVSHYRSTRPQFLFVDKGGPEQSTGVSAILHVIPAHESPSGQHFEIGCPSTSTGITYFRFGSRVPAGFKRYSPNEKTASPLLLLSPHHAAISWPIGFRSILGLICLTIPSDRNALPRTQPPILSREQEIIVHQHRFGNANNGDGVW
jgi:hypothetical protein